MKYLCLALLMVFVFCTSCQKTKVDTKTVFEKDEKYMDPKDEVLVFDDIQFVDIKYTLPLTIIKK